MLEADNPGPATHERDWTEAEQPIASHRRINEAGDSALHISDPPATLAALPAPPPSTMGNLRRPPQARPKQQPKEYLPCAQGSAVQVPPLTKHPPTTASCSTWGKNTGDSTETFVLAIPFRTDDNPDIREQRPPISNLLWALRRCPPR